MGAPVDQIVKIEHFQKLHLTLTMKMSFIFNSFEIDYMSLCSMYLLRNRNVISKTQWFDFGNKNLFWQKQWLNFGNQHVLVINKKQKCSLIKESGGQELPLGCSKTWRPWLSLSIPTKRWNLIGEWKYFLKVCASLMLWLFRT